MGFATRLFGFAVLLPLLMAAVGVWEITRGIGLSGGMVPDDVWVSRFRLTCACLAVAGGVVSVLAGLGGIVMARLSAARGRETRDALLAGFSRVAVCLPAVLGGMVGGICLAVAGITLFEVFDFWFLEDVTTTALLRLAVLGAVLAGGVLWVAGRTLRDLRRALVGLAPPPQLLLGRVVAPHDAPGLYSLVADVAARTGADMPDYVVLGLMQGFFVTASDMLAMPEGKLLRGRTLYLSAGLLAVFDTEEIAAVISHELAHFSGADTVYSQRFLPIYQGMTRSLEAVAAGARPLRRGGLPMRAAVMLARQMQQGFHGAVSYWSRVRELAADQATLAEVGPDAAARALLRSVVVAPVIAATLAEQTARPAMAGDLVQAIFLAVAGGAPGDPRSRLDQRQAHPFDSHPLTSQRIAAFGVTVDDDLAARAARPAGAAEAAFVDGLFADWAGLRARVSADVLDVARCHAAGRHAALTADLAGVADETAILETAAPGEMLVSIGLGLGGLLIGAIFLYAGVVDWGEDSDLLVLGLGLLLVGSGLFSAWSAATAIWRARSGAIMVLSREGVRMRGVAGPMGWASVDDVRLRWRRTVTVTFTFSEGAEPGFRGGWPRRVRGDGRSLVLVGLRPRGMRPRELATLIFRYRQAHAAGLELAGGLVSDGDSTVRDP